MPSLQNRTVINYIKRLSPVQRRTELEDLLNAFPDEWLDEAIVIAQAVRQARRSCPTAAAPPRMPDPLLRRRVP